MMKAADIGKVLDWARQTGSNLNPAVGEKANELGVNTEGCTFVAIGEETSEPMAFKEISRVARKPHECLECHRPINVGEKYIIHSGVWPDGPGSYSFCTTCAKERDDLLFIGMNFAYGDLYEPRQPSDTLPDGVREYWVERGWAGPPCEL